MKVEEPTSFTRKVIRFGEPWHVWVLSDHYESVPGPNGRQRTVLGDLLYRAKYGHEVPALAELLEAFRLAIFQLAGLPLAVDGVSGVTGVSAVPCNPTKPLSVPHLLADTAASALEVPNFSPAVVKIKETPPSKSTAPQFHKDAYVTRHRLDGESVLLVDDLFHTGTTLESVASRLRASGAAHVVGVCVTEAHRGMKP